MLVRIVKMHFNSAYVDDFKQLFTSVKSKIANFDGCLNVKLLQHESEPCIFFTISYWNSSAHLESYRRSDLFIETWAIVKPQFAKKAEAWSLLEQ